MKTVLKEKHVQIDRVIVWRSQFSYEYYMMNMDLLSVVTPPPIYQD